MYFSPATRKCQSLFRCYLKSSETQHSVFNVRSILCSATYSSFVSPDKTETKSAPLDLTARKIKKSKPLSSRNNVKVVRLRNRPKFDQYNNPDVFGNLSGNNPFWYPDIEEEAKIDNDQVDRSTIVRNISKKYRSPEFYLEQMKLLVSEKKLKDALELFIDMKRNFVTPEHHHYTFMIGACGRLGFTEMAFKLLRQMTDRGLKPSAATLTGLFNACGESPFPEYGLKKAQLLKDKIETKQWQINQITYHAMIKAYGKCGDIQTAFQIVDEMQKAQVQIDVVTYSFLLMSCVSNKDAGFTHAIEVWRKMKERKCNPNLFSFNLLLRAVRECDVGPEEVSCLLLQHWSSFSKRPYGFKVKEAFPKKEILSLQEVAVQDEEPSQDLVEGGSEETGRLKVEAKTSSKLLEKSNGGYLTNTVGIEVPSVLNARPVSCDELVELGQIKNASDRLTLVGGAEGFLLEMKKVGVKPNVKTFTLLLDSLPPSIEAEEHLLSFLDLYSIHPDVGFFNMLIKRRNYRFDYGAAHQVLLLINKWSLTPDIITYGVLAVGCTTYRKATFFINDMRKLGYSPNTETIGALLSNACTAVDFEYIESVLHLIEDQGIEPNERMLRMIEKALERSRNNIIDMEHGKTVPAVYSKAGFSKDYKEFCKLYENWLKNIGFEKPEHVWDQFRTDIYEKSLKDSSSEMSYSSEVVQ